MKLWVVVSFSSNVSIVVFCFDVVENCQLCDDNDVILYIYTAVHMHARTGSVRCIDQLG